MPGILGIPAIPTSAELLDLSVKAEDHLATQLVAIIDHAKQQLVDPILQAFTDLPAEVSTQLRLTLAEQMGLLFKGISAQLDAIEIPAIGPFGITRARGGAGAPAEAPKENA